MNLREFFKDLRQNQPVLMTTGLIMLILTAILAIVSMFDPQQILGINRWIKPMKFTVSTWIYLWTVAVYLNFINGFERSKKVIGWGVSALFAGEIVLVIMQAARGTTSHFNIARPFDALVFSTMGLLIAVNTLLVFYLVFLYFRAEIDLPKAIVWGMRLGLIIFLASSFEGGYMSTQIGHAVGVRDGGAGIPVFNWSSEGGDLRVAHFVGMHAFQAIPVFALMLVRLQKRFAPVRPLALTVVFALVYFVSFTLVFVQALKGKPLFGKEITVIQKSAENSRQNNE
jgi:hypothetical protein